jgi:hypothetical protein
LPLTCRSGSLAPQNKTSIMADKLSLNVIQFFTTLGEGTVSGPDVIITPNKFFDINGNPVVDFPKAQTSQIFVNGALMDERGASINEKALTIFGGASMKPVDSIQIVFVVIG